MPKHNRDKPQAIRVIFTCSGCGRTMSIYSKGDWKVKTCWNCLAEIKLVRFPPPITVTVNGKKVNFVVEPDDDDEDENPNEEEAL